MAAPKTKTSSAQSGQDQEQLDLSGLRDLLVEPASADSGHDPLGAVRPTLQQLGGDSERELPQSLLMEGGTADVRLAAALYWAGILNCTGRQAAALPGFINNPAAPCWACPACTRLISGAHRDFFVLDGRESSLKIDQIREIRKIIGEPPREDGKRVVVLAEAQQLTVEAANALLKSLEEPCAGTVFVLTAPQRERLLPTLVSRSWVLTLPWPYSGEGLLNEPAIQEWGEALTVFLKTGQGWFSRTSSKGAMDAAKMNGLIVYCRAALAASLLLRQQADVSHQAAGLPLSRILAERLDLARSRRLNEALDICEQSLANTINPALLADWLATRLFVWLEETRRKSKNQG